MNTFKRNSIADVAEGLRPFANADQLLVVDAVIAAGGNLTAAAAELGVHRSSPGKLLERLARAAARVGYAPNHFESGTAPGYLMGKVTVQRNASGEVERTWERQSPDDRRVEEALEAALTAFNTQIERATPVAAPKQVQRDLATLYTFTDYHLGMLAWRKEGGHDWDLNIAQRTIGRAMSALLAASPASALGIINIQGDFLHADGLTPITPGHGHVLDADSRFGKVIEVAIRIIRDLVAAALSKHEQVQLLICEGNHDESSSLILRKMFSFHFENDPRILVVEEEIPYYAIQHGETMLAFHHGHKKGNSQLPTYFAAAYPKMWGNTTKRYAHSGHRHHLEEKEHAGMTVTQHPTLSSRDAYAARGGWFSERACMSITYHIKYGKVGSSTVTPEMLEEDHVEA